MNEASADSTPPFVRTQTANREQQIAKRPYALQASSNLPLGGSYVKESTPNDQNRYNCRASLEHWNKRRGMRTEPQQKDTDRSSLSALTARNEACYSEGSGGSLAEAAPQVGPERGV